MTRQMGEIISCQRCPFFTMDDMSYDGWIHGKCSNGGSPDSTLPPGKCDDPKCQCPLPETPKIPVFRDGWEDITDEMSLITNHYSGKLVVGYKGGDQPFYVEVVKTCSVNEWWDYKFENGRFWNKRSPKNQKIEDDYINSRGPDGATKKTGK